MRFSLIIFLLCFFSTQSVAFAAEIIPRYTVIINQVRGTECCDPGSVGAFVRQQQELQLRSLPATFTLRYDALIDLDFVVAIKKYPEFEYGGLLEITPALAAAAGVTYRGTPENWFEAQHVFLVGYSSEERAALIRAFMTEFKNVFGEYPKTTTAWMIDPVSLKILHDQYGVKVHEITREQFGTDSYTLYGGPPHYPYWSAPDWALMPSVVTDHSPLIVRQTITDPVFNYGDQTSAFTSQPNDYLLRGATTEYFSHLFFQAHDQPQSNGYTFTMLGIENSLTEENQQEFSNQLDVIAEWQATTKGEVLTANSFYSWLRVQPARKIFVYTGTSQTDAAEQAWWITTARYRARLRLSDGVFSLTDLRVYDENFSDPYADVRAKSMGWWIVPFVLDGSRSTSTQVGQAARNDVLKNRPSSYPPVNFWQLASEVDAVTVEESESSLLVNANGESVIRFSPNSFEIFESTGGRFVPSQPVTGMSWLTDAGQAAWGFAEIENTFSSFAVPELLTTERLHQKRLLFPEIQFSAVDTQKTTLYINNRYAIAGRNPARLVLYPRDAENFPVLLQNPPEISLSVTEATVSSLPAHGSNGMIFIDITSQLPMRIDATISAGDFTQLETVYLAPNCLKHILYCLRHPKQATWFVRSVFDDKLRFFEEKKQLEEQLF